VQDAHIFLGRPGRLTLHEQVVGHAEATGGEQVRAVTIVGERARLAHQPVDDMPVVDPMLAASAQPGQFFHAPLGVPDLDPLGVEAGLDPLTDQPSRHRVHVPLHPDGAACLHPRPQPLACFQPALRQRPQQGHFFGQSGLTPGVEPDEQVFQEGAVGGAACEVPTAAKHEGLIQSLLEAVVTLLDIAVLIALASLDGLSLKPVVAQQGLVTALERLLCARGLDGGGQAVGAVQLRHATQLPESVLQAFAEALVALGEAEGARLPVGVGQDEVVEHMGEGGVLQGDAQVGTVGEVGGGDPSGVVNLGEEDLLGRAVLGAPLLEAALERA
jgi:hypothetical protein